MSEIPLRNLSIRKVSTLVVLLAVPAGLILAGAGLYLLKWPSENSQGGLWLGSGLLLAAVSVLLHLGVLLLLKVEANVNRIHHDALDLVDSLQRLEPMIERMTASSEISDAARSITHREKEQEALRQAIREEMYGGNWESAHYLIDQMERRFGYKQEAQVLKQELAQAREMTIEEKIVEAVSHIEKFMAEHRWDRARVESERLMKLFPRHERVLELPAEMHRLRETRKQELLAEWSAAVQREEIDHGIEVLTKLDQYLTREEAAALQESARHVFKERLLNLGVQFGLAVSEGRWRNALEVGLHIREEFPNSRMAHEVDAKIETLRVRAGFVSDAEITQRRTGAPAAG